MGILTAIKQFLRFILAPSVYTGGIIVAFYSVFKDVRWGLFLLVILIPQPNIWYKFHSMPLGKDFLDILFLAVLIGIFVQKKQFTSTSSSVIIILFLFWTYVSLWNSSLRFNLPLPVSYESSQLMDWKNFAQMIILYFIVQAVVENEKQQRVLFVLMAAVVLFMAIRNYRNFSGGSSFRYDKRVGGPFGAAGLGANVYAAFIAHFSVAFLGMSFFEQEKKRKILYLVTFLFCLHPLFFSYSRGAYIAVVVVVFAFYGLVKKRSLLIVLLLIFFSWHVILPVSVVDRISGTQTESGELESSANTRLKLWDQAEKIIVDHPVFGMGWGGFGLSIPKSEKLTVGKIQLTDPHNYYVETLCDFGAVGLVLLFFLFMKAFASGYQLYRSGGESVSKRVGLCLYGNRTRLYSNEFFW